MTIKSQLCFVLLLILICSVGALAQEICNNAIDDDGDGLIDINDEDCICAGLSASSLFPNPSFEDQYCCPTSNAQLDCAVGWIQASPPTTDYVHTCGNYLGNTSIPAFAPLPFPHGEGAVGFRNGAPGVGGGYKEYVGACLNEKMEIGVNYRIDFFIGFRNNVAGSKEIDLALFASTNCSALPFGSDNTAGCPTNFASYTELDIIKVTGSNEWVPVTFEFTATSEYEVIVLGPSCAFSDNANLSPYFYLDGLILAESIEFGVPFENVSGSICNDDLRIQFIEEDEKTYQWYKDGVAILGETTSELSLADATDEEGKYILLISTPESCYFSEVYTLKIPPYYELDTVSICEGEIYEIGNFAFSETGKYDALITAKDGCDSIIQLVLVVNNHSDSYQELDLCEGTNFEFNDINTSIGGIYSTVIPNSVGCDSTLTFDLIERETSSKLDYQDIYEVNLGEPINITPIFIDNSLQSFNWKNDQGELIGINNDLLDYLTFEDENLIVEAIDVFGCSTSYKISIEVDKSKLQIYLPNIFSPNGDGANDYLSIFPGPAVEEIESFKIFDRWGNMRFSEFNIPVSKAHKGWDGLSGGSKSEQGVYAYMMIIRFVDGSQISSSGSFTLIR